MKTALVLIMVAIFAVVAILLAVWIATIICGLLLDFLRFITHGKIDF